MPILGVFIPLQDIQIIYELSTVYAMIGYRAFCAEHMLVLVAVDI